MTYLDIKQINALFKEDIKNKPRIISRDKISLKDLDELKATRDYIDKIYRNLTQIHKN